MPPPESPQTTRGSVLRGAGFVLAIALGAVAVWLIVTSTTQKRIEIGVLAGLWGLLLGAYSMFGARRTAHGVEAAGSTGAEVEVRRSAAVEAASDVAARREYEARLEEMLRREIRTAMGRELASVQGEIAQLRSDLLEKVGGQLRLERIETTRIIGSDLEALQDEVRKLKDAREAAARLELPSLSYAPTTLSASRPVAESVPAAHVPASRAPAAPAVPPLGMPAAPGPARIRTVVSTAATPTTPEPARGVEPAAAPPPSRAPESSPQSANGHAGSAPAGESTWAPLRAAMAEPPPPAPPAPPAPPVSDLTAPLRRIEPAAPPPPPTAAAAPAAPVAPVAPIAATPPPTPPAAASPTLPAAPPPAAAPGPVTRTATPAPAAEADRFAASEDPFASLPRIRPFTDFALDPIEPAADDYSGRRRRTAEVVEPVGEAAGRHARTAAPAEPAGPGRRHRRADESDSGEELLARLLARDGADY